MAFTALRKHFRLAAGTGLLGLAVGCAGAPPLQEMPPPSPPVEPTPEKPEMIEGEETLLPLAPDPRPYPRMVEAFREGPRINIPIRDDICNFLPDPELRAAKHEAYREPRLRKSDPPPPAFVPAHRAAQQWMINLGANLAPDWDDGRWGDSSQDWLEETIGFYHLDVKADPNNPETRAALKDLAEEAKELEGRFGIHSGYLATMRQAARNHRLDFEQVMDRFRTTDWTYIGQAEFLRLIKEAAPLIEHNGYRNLSKLAQQVGYHTDKNGFEHPYIWPPLPEVDHVLTAMKDTRRIVGLLIFEAVAHNVTIPENMGQNAAEPDFSTQKYDSEYLKDMQRALHDLGFYDGTIDGDFGEQNIKRSKSIPALHQAQWFFDLPRTMEPDYDTYAVLRQKAAEARAFAPHHNVPVPVAAIYLHIEDKYRLDHIYQGNLSRVESSHRFRVGNNNSSAKGLVQFTVDRGLHMIQEFGPHIGFGGFSGILDYRLNEFGERDFYVALPMPGVKEQLVALRDNPWVSALMNVGHTAMIDSLFACAGLPSGGHRERYVGHFLGPDVDGDAIYFMNEMIKNPDQSTEDLLPDIVRANRFFGYSGRAEMSLARSFNVLYKRFLSGDFGLSPMPEVPMTYYVERHEAYLKDQQEQSTRAALHVPARPGPKTP